MTKHSYEVTGRRPFMGHQPGEEFKAELDPELERRAIERGSIRKATPKAKQEEGTSDE